MSRYTLLFTSRFPCKSLHLSTRHYDDIRLLPQTGSEFEVPSSESLVGYGGSECGPQRQTAWVQYSGIGKGEPWTRHLTSVSLPPYIEDVHNDISYLSKVSRSILGDVRSVVHLAKYPAPDKLSVSRCCLYAHSCLA